MKWLTLIATLAVLAVAGCGGDDENSASSSSESTPTATEASGGGGQNITIAADPNGALTFDTTTLTGKPGKSTITMDNPSDIPHAVEVEGNGVNFEGEVVGKGGKSVASGDVKAGTYDFFCPVGNHRAEGMEGKLTVK